MGLGRHKQARSRAAYLARMYASCRNPMPAALVSFTHAMLRKSATTTSKQFQTTHDALAKTGDMQAGLETFNQQPCSSESCHSVTLAKVLLFGKAAPFFAKKVTAAISFSGP